MKKRLFIITAYNLIIALLTAFAPVSVVASESNYPDITAVQNDEGTFVNMNGTLICELLQNQYLRFRANDTDHNWVGEEPRGTDLCVAYSDSGVKGIVVEEAVFTNNESEGWFEIAVTGYKAGLDCNVEYAIRGTWLPDVAKFKYSYNTSMDANLEKWYENSVEARTSYTKDSDSNAPIEIADYHIQLISYPDMMNSTSYKDYDLRYDWFLSSEDGNTWEKFPKVHVPYPTRSGDYITIEQRDDRFYEGAKFGFADGKNGGWMTTITNTSAGINYGLCWYFFDVHIYMYEAVPKRGSAERFEVTFGMDYDPISAEEGGELVEGATERNWREMDEYALPLFSRSNTFDTLISDETVPSEETAEHYIWWASSYDCYRDDTVGYDDNYSVTIKREGAQTKPAAWNTYTWGYPFEKTDIRNHKWRLSAMVKTENCTGDVRLAYAVQLNREDLFYGVGTHLSDGTPREDIIKWQYSDSLTGTNDWTPVTMEFTVSNMVNSIILEQNGSGQCWFDNVVLEDLGLVVNDEYYVYDDFEDGTSTSWSTANNSSAMSVENGTLIIQQADSATEAAQIQRTVKGYAGKWIVEMDAIANTTQATILAMYNIFNIELYGSTLLVKSGDETFTRVDTEFDTGYVMGSPIKLKVIMDFDTKVFELWYNDSKVDLGTGNYILKSTVEKVATPLTKVEYNCGGNIAIDRFMLYPDTDNGSVSVSKAAISLDEGKQYRENISLPAEGINGATITWSSSDKTAVTDNGGVLRGDEAKSATLTASISKGGVTVAKSFNISVEPYKGLTFKVDSLVPGSTGTSAKITVADDSANEYESPALLAACFNGDELIGATVRDVVLGYEPNTYSLNIDHNGTDRMKFYLWERYTLKPISPHLTYGFTALPIIEFEDNYAQVGENIAFVPYQIKNGIKTSLEKGEYTLSCDGMTADYDKNTITFTTGGLKEITVTTGEGTAVATVVINDTNDTVSVIGDTEFVSDFTADNALETYFTSTSGSYSLTKDSNGNAVLTTKASDGAHTLLFGPTLSDYTVEMEFTPTKLSGSTVNTIAVGMRAKSNTDRSSYRVAVIERNEFDGTLYYNRLAVGRASSPYASEWYYADYSDQAFAEKFTLNQKYKLVAGICGDNITATLYDNNGNVLDTICSTTAECNYNKSGAVQTALTSGQTVISFHCMVAQISDIKVYGFESVSEISVSSSADSVTIGDSIILNAFAGDTQLDSAMVEYTALSGFDISGSTAVATQSGTHSIVAKYTDYAGKVKYAIVNIEVQ